MDAKELTKKAHEYDVQLTELRSKVSDLEQQLQKINLAIKDLNALAGAVDHLYKIVNGRS